MARYDTTNACPGALARFTRGWRWQSLAILSAIWAVTQFWGIFSPPLLDDADSVHVEAVREMVLRHDYVTLYADGVRYFDKPPLPYWLGAASAKLFGIHDWSIRLPLALSVLLLIFWIYQLANRVYCEKPWGERAAFFSALIFATSIGPYLFTRFFIPDIMVALWLTIAADLVLRMENSALRHGRSKRWHPVAFGLVCAGCTLTKGLIGVVFPAGILLAYLFARKRLRLLARMRIVTGAVTYVLFAVPWHWLAAVRNPATSAEQRGWFWFYFINDQVNRYLNKRIPRDYDKVPLVLFWLLLIVWLMPWGAFLPAALRRMWRERRAAGPLAGEAQADDEKVRDRTSRAKAPTEVAAFAARPKPCPSESASLSAQSPQLLFFLWAAVILVFFSFSTRQEYYTIPAVPALALLTGIFLAREEAGAPHTRRAGSWSAGALLAIGIVVSALCFYFAATAPAPAPGADLFQTLNQHPQDYALSFGHFFDLTGPAMGFFRGPLLGTGLAMLFGTGAALFLRLRGRFAAANLALATGFVGVLMCAHQGLKIFYPILGSEPLAQVINQQRQPGSAIVIDGEYTNNSSLNFYTQQQVHMLNGRINGLWYGSLFPDAPHVFEDDSSLAGMWNGQQQVFFVTDHPDHAQKLLMERGHQIARSGGKILVVNR